MDSEESVVETYEGMRIVFDPSCPPDVIYIDVFNKAVGRKILAGKPLTTEEKRQCARVILEAQNDDTV